MQKIKYNYTAIVIVVSIFLGIVSFAVFYDHTKDYLRSICNEELLDYATHNVYSTKSELEKAVQITQASGEAFASLTDMTSMEAMKKLRLVDYCTPFEFMVLCDTKGKGINSLGGMADYSGIWGFQRAVYGESTITTIDLDGDGSLEIVISAPVAAGGKVTGTVHGIYGSFDLAKIINLNSFGGKGYAVVVNSNGDIIIPDASTDKLNRNNENYWSFFRKAEFAADVSCEDMLRDVQEKKSGFAVFSVGEEQRELHYSPLGVNDWYLLQMVNADVALNYTRPMTAMVMLLVVALILVFLAVAFTVNRQMARSRKEREAEAERFQTLAENIPGGVAELLIGEECLVQYANDGFFHMMGYSKEEFQNGWIQGRNFRVLFENDRAELMEKIRGQIGRTNQVYVEYQIRRKDNTTCWVSMTGKVITRGKDVALVQAIMTDVTLQKEKTTAIMEGARKDKMTGLYDKVSVTELITREFQMIQMGSVDALLVLDIDNFKHVNDTYGHQKGDEAIIMIADTIKEVFQAADLKGRIGGDEFMVLMKNVTSIEYAKNRVTIFQDSVRKLELAGETGRLSCSVGGVIIPMRELHDYSEVFAWADANLYQIKNSEKGQARITEYSKAQKNDMGGNAL